MSHWTGCNCPLCVGPRDPNYDTLSRGMGGSYAAGYQAARQEFAELVEAAKVFRREYSQNLIGLNALMPRENLLAALNSMSAALAKLDK